MNIDFWQQRWQQNQTGFHLSEVNENLIRYWSQLDLKPDSTVLVPLCGKSLDLVWLARQHRVKAVECSEKAINEFFGEQQLQPELCQEGAFTLHQYKNIHIYQGDFFKLDNRLLSDVSAVYDRASLVALPDQMRQQYVELLSQQLADSVSILLVTLEYDPARMAGPPFSVNDEEVHRLYQASFTVERLAQQEILETQPRFMEAGLDYLLERVYKIYR